uniref:Uncharacterized protein n=2 Tax=Loa loa TaxID=7209 RepID=A0A1I7V5R7_LOALO
STRRYIFIAYPPRLPHNQRYLRVSAPLAMGVYCETGRRTRTHFVLSVFRDHKPMKKSDYL